MPKAFSGEDVAKVVLMIEGLPKRPKPDWDDIGKRAAPILGGKAPSRQWLRTTEPVRAAVEALVGKRVRRTSTKEPSLTERQRVIIEGLRREIAERDDKLAVFGEQLVRYMAAAADRGLLLEVMLPRVVRRKS